MVYSRVWCKNFWGPDPPPIETLGDTSVRIEKMMRKSGIVVKKQVKRTRQTKVQLSCDLRYFTREQRWTTSIKDQESSFPRKKSSINISLILPALFHCPKTTTVSYSLFSWFKIIDVFASRNKTEPSLSQLFSSGWTFFPCYCHRKRMLQSDGCTWIEYEKLLIPMKTMFLWRTSVFRNDTNYKNYCSDDVSFSPLKNPLLFKWVKRNDRSGTKSIFVLSQK